MKLFVIYEKATGRVLGYVEAPFGKAADFETAENGALLVDSLPPDGMKVSGGALVPEAPEDFADARLERAKFDARVRGRQAVDQARRAFISDFPGQSMIYADKEKEAIAYLAADPEPDDLTGFYWLPKEVGVTAPTAYELAQIWVNMAALWRSVGPEIEGLRMAFQNDLSAANTTASADAAINNLMAGLEALKQQEPS